MNRSGAVNLRQADSSREPRRRRMLWFVILPALAAVAVVFMQGPNGLVEMTRRWRRVRAVDSELVAVRGQLDSLGVLSDRFRDTAFVRRYAAAVFGSDEAVSGSPGAPEPGPEPLGPPRP